MRGSASGGCMIYWRLQVSARPDLLQRTAPSLLVA